MQAETTRRSKLRSGGLLTSRKFLTFTLRPTSSGGTRIWIGDATGTCVVADILLCMIWLLALGIGDKQEERNEILRA